MVVANDLPYLEPLLFHLRKDEDLKKIFTEKSFFMPKHILIQATEEATKKSCPAPRALWIIPEDTVANNPKPGCNSIGIHSFNIVLFVQCIREPFELVRSGDGVKLSGQYMELSSIRKAVKKSVNKFQNESKLDLNLRYSDITWIKDQNLYPDDGNFLTTAIEYSVKIN